jgi:hypothetical protein
MPSLLRRNLGSDQIRREETVGAVEVEGVVREEGFADMEGEIGAKSGAS